MLRCSFKSSFLTKGKRASRPCEISFTFFGHDTLRLPKRLFVSVRVALLQSLVVDRQPPCLGSQQIECHNDAILCSVVATFAQHTTYTRTACPVTLDFSMISRGCAAKIRSGTLEDVGNRKDALRKTDLPRHVRRHQRRAGRPRQLGKWSGVSAWVRVLRAGRLRPRDKQGTGSRGPSRKSVGVYA